ncbi:MAG: hypothetical protein WB793_11600 [Candidatus Dormiibacterota bacterium]
MGRFRPVFAVAATLSLVILGTGTVSAASSAALTCSGTLAAPGFIAPGTYSSIKVTGFCLGPPTGSVIVKGDVTVAKGAALAANYPAFTTTSPEGDANWLVKGDVVVGKGATLLLGCEPAVGCVNTTFDTVRGSLDADGALGVILHSSIIGGNVNYQGGGGGVNCTPGFGPFAFGVYSDAEDDVIAGNLSVSGLHSCWFGEFRNIIMGNDTVTGNRFADSDATEIANNQVFGSLGCSNNVPIAQFGDSVQPPNVVIGAIRGECKPLSIH